MEIKNLKKNTFFLWMEWSRDIYFDQLLSITPPQIRNTSEKPIITATHAKPVSVMLPSNQFLTKA